jgi:ferritin-like protein
VASEGYHEPIEWLDQRTIEQHRAVQSIVEELEAADWYDQRVTACTDDALRAVLAHNRDEEKEHAAMGLEWWRRHDAVLDAHLRTYLFSDGSIVAEEAAAEGNAPAPDDVDAAGIASTSMTDSSLRIGSLREEIIR